MLITHPDDSTGNEYHIVNRFGNTIACYRNLETAKANLEGDQRIFTKGPFKGMVGNYWVGEAPCVHPTIVEEYIDSDGGYCPVCNSDNIEGTSGPDYCGNTVVFEIKCNDCQADWEEYYTLSGLGHIRP